MKTALILSLLCCLALGRDSFAQENLTTNHSIARVVESGKTDSFSLPLRDGDFVSLSMTQRGNVQVILRNPDGSLLRRFDGREGLEKRQLSFAAEGAGAYRIDIANLNAEPAAYELVVEKIVSLTERLKQ